MRAIVCHAFSSPEKLVLEEIASPEPNEKEVIVAVSACSLNFPDTLIVQGKYQFRPPLPFTPGSDIAGVIKSVGSKVKHLSVGQEVMGFVPYGGFAEEVVAPSATIFPKPSFLEDGIAASFLLAYGTSYHALKNRAQLQAGETLVVLGASGGVGLAAVEIGKQMGAKVIACASTDEKLALCKNHGADEGINYLTEDLKERIKILTDGKGANVIYDAVGDAFSEPALRAIAWEGRFLVVGFAAGEIPKIPLNLTLLKGCQIVGVFWGSWATQFPQDNMQNTMELLQWLSEGKLRPYIQKRYPLADAPQAMIDMMQRKVMGKVIIDCKK